MIVWECLASVFLPSDVSCTWLYSDSPVNLAKWSNWSFFWVSFSRLHKSRFRKTKAAAVCLKTKSLSTPPISARNREPLQAYKPLFPKAWLISMSNETFNFVLRSELCFLCCLPSEAYSEAADEAFDSAGAEEQRTPGGQIMGYHSQST